jgi:hypothetical protein
MSLESQEFSIGDTEKKEDQRTPSIEIYRQGQDGQLVQSSEEDGMQYLQAIKERFQGQGVGVASHIDLRPDPTNPENIIGVRIFEMVNQEKQADSTK